MEIRVLRNEEILEGIERYEKVSDRRRRKHRFLTILYSLGLIGLYLYLRLFNTGIEIDDEKEGLYRITYSTAWVVNGPSDFSHLPEEEDKKIVLSDFRKYPYMRVLKVNEGTTKLLGHLDLEPEDGSRFHLHTVELPSTLKCLMAGSFENCTSLKKVVWEETAPGTEIEMDVFCNTGIEEMILPEGVVKIWSEAFAENDALTKVVLPDSVGFLSDGVFAHCKNLREVRWSSSLAEIPAETFLGCGRLTGLTNLDDVRSITYNALSGTPVTASMLPENVYYYTGVYRGNLLSLEENPWLSEYDYSYDSQKEAGELSRREGVPVEAFELAADSGNYWLNGKYYSLDMTLEEFQDYGQWEIRDTFQWENGDCSYYLQCDGEDSGCEVKITLDQEEQIISYSFDGEECHVVLPDGVNNFGMLPERLTCLYGEEARKQYALSYLQDGVQREAVVYVNYNDGYVGTNKIVIRLNTL